MSGQYPDTFYRVAVKAVIKNDKGELLLVKEKSDKWDLPGGGLSHGESAEAGIKRELKEEVGASDIVVVKPICVKSFWLEEKQAWLMWLIYSVELKSDELILGDGVSEAKFLKPSVLAHSVDEREKFIGTFQKN